MGGSASDKIKRMAKERAGEGREGGERKGATSLARSLSSLPSRPELLELTFSPKTHPKDTET